MQTYPPKTETPSSGKEKPINQLSEKLSQIRNSQPSGQDIAALRVRVVNTTRQTLLGDSVEFATSSAKRRKGLLGRNALLSGQGLWIVPCESVHTIGMRFSIDLVFLDRNLIVKKVRGDVRPWRLSACFTGHSVIELPAGSIHKSETKLGDVLDLLESSK